MKIGYLLLLMLFVPLCMNAQEFPETEKAIMQIIIPSSWKIKYMLVDDRKLDAEKVNMKASLLFLSDSTYRLNFLGEKKSGRFDINIAEKWIRLIDPDDLKDYYIHYLDKNELWLQAYENDSDQPVLILVPVLQ